MATRNPITGDALISRTLSKEGEEQFDKIFGVKKREKYIPPPLPSIDDAYDQQEKFERINKGLE